MGNSENFDILLRLVMDAEAQKRIESGISSIEDEMMKLGTTTAEVTKQTEKNEKVTLNAMRKEAAALNRMAALRAKELGDLKEKAAWIERGARPLFTAGIAGFTAITLLAKKYIDSTEESNEITKRWAASSERVSASQMRIGKIAAEAVLPLYEKLADIAEKTADFAEKNPGVLEAGLKASIVAAGLGGIGLLVSKGITLYADIKMIAVGDMQLLAAKIMSDAAQKQLAAATGGKIAGAGGAAATAGKVATGGAAAAGGGAAIGTATTAMLVAAPVLAGILTKEVGNALQRALGQEESTWGDIATTWTQAIQLPIKFGLLELSKVAPEAAGKLNMAYSALWSWTSLLEPNAAAVTANASAAQMQAQSAQRASNAMTNTARSSDAAASSISRVPSALSSVASSISSFIQRIISGFSGTRTTTKPPTHDYTGYAYTRTYAMAQDGKRQFVMSGDMTRIAEQMLGGQLNQQAVLNAMAGSGSSKSIRIDDRRRFSGEYTKSMRRAIQNDTVDLMTKALK